jgi:hypothetical protein
MNINYRLHKISMHSKIKYIKMNTDKLRNFSFKTQLFIFTKKFNVNPQALFSDIPIMPLQSVKQK